MDHTEQKIDSDWSSKQVRNLSGCLSISIGIGIKSTIGTLFIYIISYFKQNDPSLSFSDDSKYISIYSIPAALLALKSLQICKWMGGFRRHFIIFGTIDAISFMIAAIVDNFYLFMLFYVWLPSTIAFGLFLVPILKNIWINFENEQGQLHILTMNINEYHIIDSFLTGVLLATQTISQLLFVVVSSYLINPDDVSATLIRQEGPNKIKYFGPNVTKHFNKLIWFQVAIFVVLVVGGALLITDTQTHTQLHHNQSQQLDIVQNHQYQVQDDEQQSSKQPQSNPINNDNDDDKLIYKEILSYNFICYFMIALFLYAYDSYINIIIKEVFLKDNIEDLLINYLMIAFQIANSNGKVILGYLFDKVRFPLLFKSTIILYFLSTVCLAIFYSTSTKVFVACYLSFGFLQGGLSSVEAIGLNHLFGQQLGCQLYPYKGISFHIGNFSTALMIEWMIHSFRIHQIFYMYSAVAFISVILSQLIKY